jgi:V8-like Glu-specific endopeptidase
MKLQILTILGIFCVIATADLGSDFEVNEISLDVPADPDSWVFQGENDITERAGRISNGNQATNTQFPWVAELGINTRTGGLLCTASLISNTWILGARHCIAE